MSVDTNFHVGPYIKVKELLESYTETINSCSNKECKNFGKELDGKFCMECSSKIEETHIPKKGYFGYDDFMEETNLDVDTFRECESSVLIKKNEFLLIENGRAKNGPRMLDPEGPLEKINSQAVDNELTWFIKEYEKYINMFKSKFGENNVEVGYAAFVFYS